MSRGIFILLYMATVLSSTCVGAQITENFTAVTNGGAPLTGTLGFDPDAFTPPPFTPSGSVYLNTFTGGPGSVLLQLDEGSIAVDLSADNSQVFICSGCNLAWDLNATFAQTSLSIVLNSLLPITYTPGTSIFNPGDFLNSTSTLDAMLSDPDTTLNFSIQTISADPSAPEPASFWTAGIGVGVLLCTRLLPRCPLTKTTIRKPRV